MKELEHKCCVCRHRWESIDDDSGPKLVKAADVAKKVREAANVNADGPYCNLCRHLEMAERYALARGFAGLEGAVKKWRVLSSKRK